jgi:hypothetical protein
MKKPVLVLGAAVVLAGGIAAYLWLELRTTREQGGALVARVAALESAQRAAASVPLPPESHAPEPQAPALPAQAAAVVTKAAPPTVPQSSAPQQPAANAADPPAAAMLQTPQGQDFTRSMMRNAMAQMYPDVQKELGLTAAETERLFTLLSGDEDDLMADTMSLMSGKLSPEERRKIENKLVESERTQETKVAALLGSRYPKWEEYQATSAARQQVTALRTTLSYSGNPLSKPQEEALTTAFAATQSRNMKEQRDSLNSPAAANSMQDSLQTALKAQRELLDAAAPHLNAAQLAQFRRQVEQQEQMMSATMGMLGGKSDAAAKTPATSPRAP